MNERIESLLSLDPNIPSVAGATLMRHLKDGQVIRLPDRIALVGASDMVPGAITSPVTPAVARALGFKALKLGVHGNEFARKASLDKGGTTGRRDVVVPLDAQGRIPAATLKLPTAELSPATHRAVAVTTRRAALVTRTNRLTAEAAQLLETRRAWMTGEPVTQDDAAQLAKWRAALHHCSGYVEVHACPCCGTGRTRSDCCACPPCVREQRRRSRQWVRRAMHLWEKLPPTRTHRWRLVTMSLRKTNDVGADLDATIKMRGELMRVLRDQFGMLAGFGAVEQGENSNIHLHALVYSRFLERPRLQQFLRSRDCTIPGCRHPADDRCDACRAAKCACAHPDGERPRCNGSWVVDLQAVKGRKGIIEAIKYAAAPVAVDDVPKIDEPATPTQLAHAERLLRFYLALRNRHRVETYGEAKSDDGPTADDDDAPLATEVAPCGRCGRELDFVAFGVNQTGTYVWYRAQFGSE